jgi:hypothetical protein
MFRYSFKKKAIISGRSILLSPNEDSLIMVIRDERVVISDLLDYLQLLKSFNREGEVEFGRKVLGRE